MLNVFDSRIDTEGDSCLETFFVLFNGLQVGLTPVLAPRMPVVTEGVGKSRP